MHALSTGSSSAVREATLAAALSNERGVCVGRIILFSTILIRFLAITSVGPLGISVTAIPLAVGIGFSVYVLLAVKTPPAGPALWWTSVGIDAIAVFCALLTNALWPTDSYLGVSSAPDTAAMLISTMGAGLRLSTAAALFGGAMNVAGFLILVAVDHLVSADRGDGGTHTMSLYLVWLLGASLVAVVLAWTTRRLTLRGALAVTRVERAEQGLWSVLATHHDLRSMLSAARIDAETLRESLAKGEGDPRSRAAAHDLEHTILEVCGLVESVKDRAVGSLDEAMPPAPVAVGEVARAVIQRVLRRFPQVSIHLEVSSDDLSVMVAGGATSLQRMLGNLLQNACEGDGHAGAKNVRVIATLDDATGRVTLRVEDDGPGLPGTRSAGERGTTKLDGVGVGLQVVRGLAEASGGSLHAERGGRRGCVVRVVLPAA